MSLESPIIGAKPQWLESDPSAVCTLGRPPLIMTGIILWALRRHFSSASWIIDDLLRDKLWTDDSTTTRILIEPVTRWSGANTQIIGSRPAIYVKRNQYSPIRIGIADRYQVGLNQIIDTTNRIPHNNIDSGIRYGVIMAGSHTVFCLGGTGAEAETLGTEVLFELMEFAPLIRQDFDLNKFQVMEMGGLAKLEESHEHWVVPISVAFAFNHDWELRQDLPAFKTAAVMAEIGGIR